MASRRKLERAKRRFLAETEDREWLRAVGIGLVEKHLGLIISVRPGAKSAASRLLNQLDLDVPILLRAIKDVRARGRSKEPARHETQSMGRLRKAALARFSRPHG